ncbi:uncharacterized protein [Nicotiana sylvestris]|uniref:uncharacterized protein n=1 Tax=Nicotiana sylvestris TaxID=4096 RepID=UPI00388CAC9F
MTTSENSVEEERPVSQLLKEAMEKIERIRLEMNVMQLALAKVQKSPEPPVTLTLGNMPEYPHPGPSTSLPNHYYYQGRNPYDSQAPPPHQHFPPPNVPAFMGPTPATLQRSTTEPHTYNPHLEVPTEIEKPDKVPEQDEGMRKFKSLEQSFRSMHGLGNQVSVAYKDLCPFPDIQLPAGFKMTKFDLYEGHGDPMAHLWGFCSKMRGAGGKDELPIAYFGQSLSGPALEWHTRQDPSRWYTWDDLAQAFAVNHLETIANKIFEVNRVTFSDDDLPVEGTEHNKALYLTVKCED